MYTQNLIEQTRNDAKALARKAEAAKRLQENDGLYNTVHRMGQLTDRIFNHNGNSMMIAMIIMVLSFLGMILGIVYSPAVSLHMSMILLPPTISISSFLYVRFVIYRNDRKQMICELLTLCDTHPEAVTVLDHIEPGVVRYINKILKRARLNVSHSQSLSQS